MPPLAQTETPGVAVSIRIWFAVRIGHLPYERAIASSAGRPRGIKSKPTTITENTRRKNNPEP
jgi:hypothetical protein